MHIPRLVSFQTFLILPGIPSLVPRGQPGSGRCGVDRVRVFCFSRALGLHAPRFFLGAFPIVCIYLLPWPGFLSFSLLLFFVVPSPL
jgi:hypothetical protein